MKMVRKIVSLLLSLTMLPTVTQMVSAQDSVSEYATGAGVTPAKWLVEYKGKGLLDKSVDYIGTARNQGRTGDAMAIKFTQPNHDMGYVTAGNVNAGFPNITNGTKIRITFWVKGDIGGLRILPHNDTNNGAGGGNTAATAGTLTPGTVDGDWTQYTADVTSVNSAWFISFMPFSQVDCLIDDVSVQKLNEVTDEETGETTYEPDGTELMLIDGNNIGDFDDGYGYGFSHDFDVEDEADLYRPNGWSRFNGSHYNEADYKDTNGHTIHAVSKVTPTKKYAKNGEYALYIQSDFLTTANTYFQINGNVMNNLDTNKTYVLEYWVKMSNFSSGEDNNLRIGADWQWISPMNAAVTKTYPDEDGWMKCSYKFTPNAASKRIAILLQSRCELVVDDIKVYEEGKPDVNLVVNGDFEDCVMTASSSDLKFDDWKYDKRSTMPNLKYGRFWYMEPSTAVPGGENNNYSAHMFYNETVQNCWMWYTKQLDTPLPAGTYTVSMDVKGITSTSDAGAFTFNGDGANNTISNNSPTLSTADANGWRTLSFTYGKEVEITEIGYKFWNIKDVYVDNITITKDGETTPVFTEDFEDVVSNELVHPMTFGINGGLVVSWTNPARANVADYKIYVDEKLAADSAKTTPGAFNEVKIDGLENYKEYAVKLVEVDFDGNEKTYELTGMPDDKNDYAVGAWKVQRHKNVAISGKRQSWQNNVFTLEKDGGNTAMRIDVNLPDVADNLYPNIYQQLAIENVNDYKLTFKYKTENAARFWLMPNVRYTDANGEYHNHWSARVLPADSNGWQTYELILNNENILCTQGGCTNNKAFFTTEDADLELNLYFAFEQGTGTAWVDDIELYEYKSWDEVTTGDNLIKNGDFEFGYEVLAPEFKLVNGENKTVINNIAEGKIEAVAKIKNYDEADFMPGIIYALYNGSKLLQVRTVQLETSLEPTAAVVPADEFTAEFDVPALDTGDYHIKVFYWDGIASLDPLCDADELKEAAVAE